MTAGWLDAAAGLLLGVSLAHSVLGETMLFRRVRGAAWLQADTGRRLGRGHLGILWATWHGVTALGCGIAAVFGWLAGMPPAARAPMAFVDDTLAGALAVVALLVLVGTRGRHPGWIGLLATAVLAWLGRGA